MKRPVGVPVFLALSALLLCGASSPTQCTGHIGPSTGEVVGIAVGIGAAVTVGVVVLVEVNQSHHRIKGCVSSGPNGLEVANDSDHRVYSLTGTSAQIHAGDIVRVQGQKEKYAKGSTANRVFRVEKIGKDYGPCQVQSAASPAH